MSDDASPTVTVPRATLVTLHRMLCGMPAHDAAQWDALVGMQKLVAEALDGDSRATSTWQPGETAPYGPAVLVYHPPRTRSTPDAYWDAHIDRRDDMRFWRRHGRIDGTYWVPIPPLPVVNVEPRVAEELTETDP